MAWWLATLVLYAGSVVISALLSKFQKVENTPGDLQFPTADPKKPIPVVYGKHRIGMNVVYKANLTFGENTVRGTAPFGWSPQHIGYFYYADIMATLCWGKLDAVWDVIVDGDVSLASADAARQAEINVDGVTYATGAAMSTYATVETPDGSVSIQIAAGNILGGKFGRGGVGAGADTGSTGDLLITTGNGEPVTSTRFETLAGTALPKYPHVACAYFQNDFYLGNSESLPSIEFIVSRATPMAGGTGYVGNFTAVSGNDAESGSILFDLLTNPHYGLGLPSADIDFGAFNALNGATFGLSFVLTEQTPAKQVLEDLMRTLDGVLYTHPTTGLLTIYMLRDPSDATYGIGGAPTIDESIIVEDSFVWSDSAADGTVNEVKVEFADRDRMYTTNVATVRNTAAIQELGRVESRTVRFLGVTNVDTAYLLAQRELRALSTSLGHASFEVDRTGYVYTPGQFFYLTYAPRGFTAKVMRVVSVRDTPLGKIAVDAVEDVYSSATLSFTPLSPEEPTPPTPTPFLAPWVEEFTSQTVTTGTLSLFVYDPAGVVTSVEFQTTSGTGSPSGYATDAYPYAASVTLSGTANSAIDYRVNYTDQAGDPATLEGTVVFGVDTDQAETTAETVTTVANTVGQIGIPVQLLAVPEDDQWLALSTIPTAETEVGAEYRQQSYAVGVGSVRLGANIKAKTGSPTIGATYTTNAFGATAALVSFTPSGTGVQYSGFTPMPAGAKADIGVTWTVGAGADTAALDLYRVWLEYIPATVSGGRVHTAAHTPAFN